MKRVGTVLTVLAATLFCSLVVRAQDIPLKALFPNDPLKVYLDSTTELDFLYQATQAETISIYASSLSTNAEGVDSVLAIYDAGGSLLAENDDRSLGNGDSAIEGFTLSEAGDYTIRLSAYPDTPSGGVELIVITGDGVRPTEAVVEDQCDEATISVGDSLNASVSGGTPTEFIFCGEQGQVVTISAIAINPATPNQDLKMTLLDANGTMLAENDDIDTNRGNWDSMITDFTVPTDGLYTIQVRSVSNRSGSFSLTLEEG